MERIPTRCAFGDQNSVLFTGKDMELASIHARVSERLGINMQKNMLKYLLPIDGHVEQVLHDDGDVQAMFDLHKSQGTSFINLHIHAADSRYLSTHASRQSGDPPQLVMRGNSIYITTDRYILPCVVSMHFSTAFMLSHASQVLQTRMSLLWKPQNCPTYQEVV
ncbi:hypothetical protein Taro_028813 [Colocasia esculenta]|uniref:PB1 domain-containing protein n=1 Tax=Colocasia esculenta TaxID=4460 RepID=A0A843VYD7_COLES|nr:hypothetical protein [Colocasia esculenta]